MARRRALVVLLSPPAVVVCVIFALTLLAPWISPYNPDSQDLAQRLQSPSWQHLLGTDHLGRDTFSRIIYGGRFSLAVALGTTLFSLFLGTVLGLLSALRRGWVDELFLRFNDMLLALPEIVVALLVIAMFGPGSLSMILAVGLVAWTPTARLVRAMAVQVLSTGYVEASRHVGAGQWFIIRRHVLRVLIAPVLAQTALRFGLLLVLLGSLSYLGIGVQPPQSDWGSMLAEAQPYATVSPWGLIAPGGAIFSVSLSVTLIAHRLSRSQDQGDVLDTEVAISGKQ